jgi:hypothetical protein
MIWNYRGLEVYFLPDLDGDGTNQAASFVRFIKSHFPKGKRFPRILEWCAGPGFIGFSLLKEGLCDSLCLADINAKAIDCIKKTVESNGLGDAVTYHLSDNLDNIPLAERFDLVVANPPSYYALNPKNLAGQKLINDIRCNDRAWEIHRRFYSTIAPYLNKGACLLISEVEPFNRLVFNSTSDSIPYDIRQDPPIEDFKKMICEAGLTYIGAKHFHSSFDRVYSDGAIINEVVNKLYLVISRKE